MSVHLNVTGGETKLDPYAEMCCGDKKSGYHPTSKRPFYRCCGYAILFFSLYEYITSSCNYQIMQALFAVVQEQNKIIYFSCI